MQAERRQNMRVAFDRFLDIFSVISYRLFPAWLDLGDDGKSVAGGSLGKDRAESSVLELE